MIKKTNFDFNRPNLKEYKSVEKHRLAVVLDNIRSQHNVGSVFRTSDAFLVEKLFLCGITSTPPHREIHKTALGATDSVDWEYYSQTKDAILHLKSQGFSIVALEQTTNSVSFKDLDCSKPVALIIGNEVEGVSEDCLAMSDQVVEIPQYGTKQSLNVSVSAGIAIWEIIKTIKLA